MAAGAVLAGVGLAASTAHAQVDFSSVTEPIGDYVAARPLVPGAGLVLMDFDGNVIHEQYWGDFDRDTVVPIASATKWLSAGVIMSLADDGLLDLDQPVGEVLPEFAGFTDGRSDFTVRQMFSHTAGLPGQSFQIGRTDITLAQAVANLAAAPGLMQSAPGAEFRYGGVSMHIAGRVAEVLAGSDWVTLFDQRLQAPLGVSDTDFTGVGNESNPRIAGGARSSIETYTRFLTMLANDGVYGGQRVLSPDAVATLLTDQTGFGQPGGAALDSAPVSIDQYLGYGVGGWVERRDAGGAPVEWSSPGGFGTTPWIDLENRYFGVFMIDDVLSGVDDLIDDVRAFAAAAIDPVLGDYTGDGRVDQADLDLVLLNWGRDALAEGVPAGWVSQRPTGVIGQVDLDAVLLYWGGGAASASASQALPEPGCVGGGVFMAALMLGRRRR